MSDCSDIVLDELLDKLESKSREFHKKYHDLKSHAVNRIGDLEKEVMVLQDEVVALRKCNDEFGKENDRLRNDYHNALVKVTDIIEQLDNLIKEFK